MSDTNPYTAPRVAELIKEKLRDLRQLDDKDFKKLYNRSSNVSAIAALILLGMLVNVGITFIPDYSADFYKIVFYGIALVQLISFIGLVSRTGWGRIMGIICCSLMIINPPLGTLIGIAGLFSFVKAPELFGEGKVSKKALSAEFELRKREKKAAKKQAKLDKKAAKKKVA